MQLSIKKVQKLDQFPVEFKRQTIDSLKDIVNYKRDMHVVCAMLFKDNKRSKKNFERADLVKFDVDGGLSIEDCLSRLEGLSLTYALVTSKSHLKNGIARYHVFLQLDKPVYSALEYTNAMQRVFELFPEADEAAADAGRMFSPSLADSKAWSNKGKLFDPTDKTKYHLKGMRNDSLHKTASRWRGDGAEADEILTKLQEMNGVTIIPALPEEELESITRQAMQYEPNEPQVDDLGFQTADEIIKSNEKLDWVVDGLFMVGGFSLFAGAPKCGKSTLMRQLCKSIITGQDFLDRKVRKGKVFYFALEEYAPMLKQQYMKSEINGKDLLVTTKPLTANPLPALERMIKMHQPTMVIFDTMNLATQISNLNDYAEVTKRLEPFRTLARETGVHFLFIYHSNKNPDARGTNRIMGSTGIRGAMDCSIVMEQPHNSSLHRILNSEQRGGRPFMGTRVEFSPQTGEYTMVKPKPSLSTVKGGSDVKF